MSTKEELKRELSAVVSGTSELVEREEEIFWIKGEKSRALRQSTTNIFLSDVAGYLERLTVVRTLAAICSYIDRGLESCQTPNLKGISGEESANSGEKVFQVVNDE
jgi:hypothetical protein